jgi:predicted aldo/keto reductase-like oxidoreductase
MSKECKSNDFNNKNKKTISRREFIEITGSALIGSAFILPNLNAENDPHVKPETGMKYRRLGKTNLMVSVIGLGNASGSLSQQLGPFLFAKWLRDRKDVANKYLDLGGNYIATGPEYHNTEEILGDALKNRRQEVFYSIDVNPPLTEDNIRKSVETSLKRFHTDYLDLCCSHGEATEKGFEVLKQLQKEGKIRFVGLTQHNPLLHEWAIRNGYVDYIQTPYNRLSMIKQGPNDNPGAEKLLKVAKEYDVGVMGIKPLTGNFIPYWAKQTADPEIQEIMKLLKNYGPENLYQAMLKWNLKNPLLTGCIVGMDTVQQLVEDVEAIKTSELTTDQEELFEKYLKLADNDYCRLCEMCVPQCPKEIPIPDILRFRMYYNNYQWGDYAKGLYNKLPKNKKITNCDLCGICEEYCPYNLKIMEKLNLAHSVLAEEDKLVI